MGEIKREGSFSEDPCDMRADRRRKMVGTGWRVREVDVGKGGERGGESTKTNFA